MWYYLLWRCIDAACALCRAVIPHPADTSHREALLICLYVSSLCDRCRVAQQKQLELQRRAAQLAHRVLPRRQLASSHVAKTWAALLELKTHASPWTWLSSLWCLNLSRLSPSQPNSETLKTWRTSSPTLTGHWRVSTNLSGYSGLTGAFVPPVSRANNRSLPSGF